MAPVATTGCFKEVLMQVWSIVSGGRRPDMNRGCETTFHLLVPLWAPTLGPPRLVFPLAEDLELVKFSSRCLFKCLVKCYLFWPHVF